MARFSRILTAPLDGAGKQLSLNQERYWSGYIHQTQARYLRAIEALARVRRLAQRTPVQINIGGQQINVVNQPSNESDNLNAK